MGALSDNQMKRLVELHRERYRLMSEFYEISKRQSGYITGDDMTLLDSSLAERQEIIDKTDKLHQEFDVLMQSHISGGVQSSDELEQAEAEFQALLRLIFELDVENRRTAEEVMRQSVDEAKRLALGRRGLGAYNQTDLISNMPGFFDKKQ